MTSQDKWFELCALDDIPLRGGRRIILDEKGVALFRTKDNSVYAIEDSCPHLGGRLSDGIVHDNCVTCPLHNLVIDLQTGVARSPEAQTVACYPVKVIDNKVYFLPVAAVLEKL